MSSDINRWHMNRMGLINFWLYDDQEFTFCDGKLMLRGQNASGKSITTQSFIPFILDGNRAPSRLDPFGSSDRKMDYYFLGNTDRDDVTGYLYLEFKREKTDEYRTIGIGQRAQRGKNDMAFWGFLLMDGRRVGVDLFLTRKTGDIYIPLTKKELKNELGETGYMYDTRREYAAAVNKHLFGFPRMEQYEQFIQLLIKVRAPKLDKGFKPSRIYEILNESLQTLTDDDLRSMVDAMEKMDEIETHLENLCRTSKDLGAILQEYTKYNHFMLGKKAENYVRAKDAADRSTGLYESMRDETENLKADIDKLESRHQRLNEDMSILRKKIELWRDSDLHRSVQKKEEIESQLTGWRARIQMLEGDLEKCRDRIRDIEESIHDCKQTLEVISDQIRRKTDEEDKLAGVLNLSVRDEVRQAAAGTDPDPAQVRDVIERARAEAREISGHIKRAVKSIETYDRERHAYDDEIRRLDSCRVRLSECMNLIRENEQRSDRVKDECIEAWYEMRDNNEEFLPSEDQIREITNMVRIYDSEVLTLYRQFARDIWSRLDDDITKKLQQAEFDRKNCKNGIAELKKELKELESRQEPEPERDADTESARRELREKGIPFVPFYRGVDFAADCEESSMILIEKQVRMSGLLDALIVPAAFREQAGEIRKKYSDVVFAQPGTSSGTNVSEDQETVSDTDAAGAGLFIVEPEIKDEQLIREVQAVIDRISTDPDSDAEWVISPDGYFRNGVIEGCAHVTEEDSVNYIGAATRRSLWLRVLDEKRAEIADKEKQEAEIAGMCAEYAVRKNKLGAEYGMTPTPDELDRLYHESKRLEQEESRLRIETEAQEKVTEKANRRRREAESRMVMECAGLPCNRTLEALQELENVAEDYQDVVSDLLIRMNDRDREFSTIREKKIQLEDQEDRRGSLDVDLRDTKSREREGTETLRDIENFLSDPENRRLAEEMSSADHDLDNMQRSVEEIIGQIGGKKGILEKNEEELPIRRSVMTEALEREKVSLEYLDEELRLGFDGSAAEGGSPESKGDVDDRYELAEKLVSEYREVCLSTEADRIGSLMDCFQKHSSGIMSYGLSMEDRFGEASHEGLVRKRKVMTAVWVGNRLPLFDFRERIDDAIEETKTLIRKRDRELFENILSDTVSRKLSDRITESKQWIRDMSKLMKGIDTSMGLSFELRWKPRKSEGDKFLDSDELERLIRQDKGLLMQADSDRLAEHFRAHIHDAKNRAAESGDVPNYYEMVREILDYRQWFEFHMMYVRQGEDPKELTDRVFNRFSGGEKAMAMYVPLFAAVNSQYRKTEREDYPRILALDEAFAGVDEINIDSMFGLVEALGFDYIMNSQFLWGCYETVPSLRIAELIRPKDAPEVTVIFYRWNGRVKELEG